MSETRQSVAADESKVREETGKGEREGGYQVICRCEQNTNLIVFAVKSTIRRERRNGVCFGCVCRARCSYKQTIGYDICKSRTGHRVQSELERALSRPQCEFNSALFSRTPRFGFVRPTKKLSVTYASLCDTSNS